MEKKTAKVQSLPGGACINFKPCRAASSDRHNERAMLDQMNNNIDPGLSKYNWQWKCKAYESLSDYEKKAIADYESQPPKTRKVYVPKTGGYVVTKRKNKWRSDGVAMREAIVVNLLDTSRETANKILRLGKTLEEKHGIKLLRLYVHADEHRVDSITGEDKFNLHAHLVFGWYDFKNHKPISINPDAMSEIQDLNAEITEVPRGNRTGHSGRKGLSNLDYKQAMSFIDSQNHRKEGLLSEYYSLCERLGYLSKIKGLLTEEDLDMLEKREDNKREVESWKPEVIHPLAYKNCVDRFEKNVKKLRTRVTELELALPKYLTDLTYLITEKKRELQNIPSSLNIVRFIAEHMQQVFSKIQSLVNTRYGGEIIGMERKQNKEGVYYEQIQMNERGRHYELHVYEKSGNIFYSSNTQRSRKDAPIPKLANYLRAEITPQMRELLEDSFPITQDIKNKVEERNARNKGIKHTS